MSDHQSFPADFQQLNKSLNDRMLSQLSENIETMLAEPVSSLLVGEDLTPENLPQVLDKKFPRLWELNFLLKGVYNSAVAVLKLCREGDDNSAYIVARALIERAGNFAYLTVCEIEEFQAWRDYSFQKALRMVNRGKQVGSFHARFEHLPSVDLVNHDDLETIFKPFTGKTGREITRWSSRTLDQRLEYVQGTFEDSEYAVARLATALLLVHDMGAEAQHGTYLGVAIRRGFSPPNNVEDDYHEAVLESSVLGSAIATSLSLSAFVNRPDWAKWTKNNISNPLDTKLMAERIDSSRPLSAEEREYFLSIYEATGVTPPTHVQAKFDESLRLTTEGSLPPEQEVE